MYYFISKHNFDSDILEPRIPINRLEDEDDKIKRVCVSKSIVGCLSAIAPPENEILIVHTCDSINVIQPTVEQVPDVMFTGEEWILEPVNMNYLMTIKTIKKFDNNIYDYGVTINTYTYEIIKTNK